MKPSLAETALFSDIPPDLMAALDAVAEWFSLPAGWPGVLETRVRAA